LLAPRIPLPEKHGLTSPFMAGIFLLFGVLAVGLCSLASAQLAEGNSRLALPQSQLGQPFETPIFLVGHAAYGGGFRNQSGDLGFGGSLIFRPGSSVNIFGGILDWRAGMVIQVDYLKIPDGGDITSADLILRRYFFNRGDRKTEVNPFLGLGSGISKIGRPDPDDVAEGDHWSILLEAGQEWYFKPTFMFYLKAQYRWMINAGRTYRTWSVLMGAGFAWP
jgi:hypothetical protein